MPIRPGFDRQLRSMFLTRELEVELGPTHFEWRWP